MEYQIYTPGLRQGSWIWGWRTAIYVIYGPEEEIARFKTIASVESRNCPNVHAECIDYDVDRRHQGPRSRYGQAIREAKEWISTHRSANT